MQINMHILFCDENITKLVTAVHEYVYVCIYLNINVHIHSSIDISLFSHVIYFFTLMDVHFKRFKCSDLRNERAFQRCCRLPLSYRYTCICIYIYKYTELCIFVIFLMCVYMYIRFKCTNLRDQRAIQ